MKAKWLMLSVLLLGAQIVYADSSCPAGTFLRKINNAQTATASIDTSGHDVRLITMACSGTACEAGLYDVDDGVANDDLVIEPVGAANAFVSIPTTGFFEPPLRFDNGIYFVDDANVHVVQLYECR